MKSLIRFLRKRISIKGRLLLMFIVPGFIYYVFSAAVSFSHIYSISTALNTELKLVVESAVGQMASTSLSRGVKTDLKKVIDSLISATDIVNIVVYDIDNNVFASSGQFGSAFADATFNYEIIRERVIPDFDEFDFNDGVATGAAETIGRIEYQINDDVLIAQSWRVIVGESLLLLLTLFLCTPLFYALYKSFSKPLNYIMDDILELEKGNLFEINVDRTDDDEFTRVTYALRRVASTLINQTTQIQDANATLKKRAEELENQVSIAIEAREAADRANAQKDTFVANISHEMRTPLAGVVSGTDLVEQYITSALTELLNNQDQLSTEQYAFITNLRKDLKAGLGSVDIAKESSRQLMTMVNDLLSSIQDMYQEIVLRPSEFIVSESLTVLLKSHYEHARAKGISYEFSIKGVSEGEHIHAAGDWVRLSQVVNNMISNAIRFTEKGGVSVIALIDCTHDEVIFSISVADTGVGISNNEKESIFKLFHIGENPADKQYSGLGTGLAIAQKISQRMGGQLNLDQSSIGTGSKFSFNLSLPRSINSQKLSEGINKPTSDKISLLYVEDSATNRQVFQMYCNLSDINLILAENGKEGVERYNNHRFDALIVDCYMPGMNGFEFVKKIRKWESSDEGQHIPIFALTADASTKNKQRCFDAGFDEFVTKPYTHETFKFIVDRIKYINEKEDAINAEIDP